MKTNFEHELEEFLSDSPESSSAGAQLPPELLARVKTDLQPSLGQLFLRLGQIQFGAGAVSLALCPQFGVSYFKSEGLMHFFMMFGPLGCQVLCGAFFAGVGLGLAAMMMSLDELRAIRRQKWLLGLAVTSLSLGALAGMGEPLSIELSLAWLLGALVVGVGALEFGARKRLSGAGA